MAWNSYVWWEAEREIWGRRWEALGYILEQHLWLLKQLYQRKEQLQDTLVKLWLDSVYYIKPLQPFVGVESFSYFNNSAASNKTEASQLCSSFIINSTLYSNWKYPASVNINTTWQVKRTPRHHQLLNKNQSCGCCLWRICSGSFQRCEHLEVNAREQLETLRF